MSAETTTELRTRFVPLALWFAAAMLALNGIALGAAMRAYNDAMVPSLGVIALTGFAALIVMTAFVASTAIAPWSQPGRAMRLVLARWTFLVVACVASAGLVPITVWTLLRVRVERLERDVAELCSTIQAEVTRAGVPPAFVESSFGRVASGTSTPVGDASLVYLRCADSESAHAALVYDLGPAEDERLPARFTGGAAQRCELVIVLDATGRVASIAAERGANVWQRAFDGDEWLAHPDRRASMAADLAWNSRLAGCTRADLLGRLGPPTAERSVRDTAWELQATFSNHDVFCFRSTGAYEPYMRRVGGWGHWCDNAWD